MSYHADDAKAIEIRPDWLQSYIDSPEKQRQLYKRTLIIVVLSQIFGGAGLAAGITVGALIAQDMLGTDQFAGVPTALFTLGSAAAAYIVGRLSQRFGRRSGLAAGFLTGGIGAIGVVIAAITNNFLLLFASLLICGAGSATNLQARYAGTDMASSKQRATAISTAMVSTTFGAVAGPNMVEVMGEFATSIGIPALAGPFILAATAFILAGLVLLVFLRPDPLVVANVIARVKSKEEVNLSIETPRDTQEINNHGVVLGTVLMIVTQLVMVGIMTMTPVHMRHHGHGLSDVGMVIGIHVAFMFLPSFFTGILVDKIGRSAMAIAAGITLLAAGVIAAFSTADSMAGIITALALLGLGWNFGLICGTALVVDSTLPTTRAKTQGTVDVLIALAGATGGVLSGMVAAHSSYAVLSLAGGFLSLLLIPVVVWSRNK
ncbi:MFS transporter [Neobacillus sp. 19]|uniref:MFS transporter n=1 Tax=Neobacillus sp. 19 TaxID=3394458 RepID=UPI003BF72C6B